MAKIFFLFLLKHGVPITSPEVQNETVTPATLHGRDAGSNKWRNLIWVLVGAGIFFRLFHYFDNRSLWVDEVYLASSLIKMNFWELTAPALEYEQKAPIGFLWLVRLAVVSFGKGEMALRLIPLLAGLASLFLFVPVCHYFLKPLGVVVAVGLLALAPPLIYHSVEIKQYSTELLATIVALYLYTRYHQKNDLWSMVVWGLWGAIIIWFSYASIFILAGMAGGMGFYYLLRQDWPAFFRSAIIGTVWLLSFVINYYLFTNKYADSEWLVIWFRDKASFMPFPPTSLTDLLWFPKALNKIFFYPLGLLWQSTEINSTLPHILLRWPILPFLFLATGLVVVFRQNQKLFWVLSFPLVLTLVASGLEIYPFYERLIVFLAPTFILFIAWGLNYLVKFLPSGSKVRYLLVILLLGIPLASSAYQVKNQNLFGGYKKAYHRETLVYINNHFQPGDVVYVYWNVQHTYKFYKDAYGLKFDALVGKDVRYKSANTEEYFQNLKPDFKALAGEKRVWVIYNKFYVVNTGDIIGTPAYYYADLINGEKLYHKFLTMGKEVQTYKTVDVNVSLFDFSKQK